MLLALLAALLAAQPARPFTEERLLLDRRLETLRRILPDGPTASADVLLVRDLAESARLARVEIQPRPPVESGARGEVVLDLTALGGYEEIDRFFQKVAVSHRLVDVESLTLTATSENVIQLAAVLRFPYWPARAPLPPPPESPKGRPAGVPRPTLDAFLRDQSLAFAKSDAIAARRRARRSPRLFLSELAAVARERPVVLGYASLGEEFTVRGLAVGEGPMRAFERRLERGFLRVSEFLMAKQGACHRFEAHGKSPVAGPDAELPVPVDDPFEQDPAPCRVDRDAARSVVVKGRAPTAKDPGRGPAHPAPAGRGLRRRLPGARRARRRRLRGPRERRGADERRGDARHARRDARRHPQGVGRSRSPTPGPVRVVSTARLATRSDAPAGGAPASFALKRVEVRDLLAGMADVDPGLAAARPARASSAASACGRRTRRCRGSLGRPGRGRAHGAHRGGPPRRGAARRARARRRCPVARAGPEPRLALRREELTVLEFQLAGVASAGESFVAFAYAPTGQLYAYRPGDRLADGVVRAVESTDVLLETEEGPLRLPLPRCRTEPRGRRASRSPSSTKTRPRTCTMKRIERWSAR